MYDSIAVRDLNRSRNHRFVEGTVQCTGTFQCTQGSVSWKRSTFNPSTTLAQWDELDYIYMKMLTVHLPVQ